MAEACLKHSNLFKVKDPTTCPPLSEEGSKLQEDRRTTPGTHACNHGGPGRSHQKSNYELFNCSNFNIRYWSWNYRGCWPLNVPAGYYAYSTLDQLVLTALTESNTLTGGLARSLSVHTHFACVHPHLSARYDGHQLR